MAITKQKKVGIVSEATERIKNAASVIFVNWNGVKTKESDEMRLSLRKQGMGYYVAKKTLIRRALKDAGIAGDMPEFAGEIAIAYGADAVLPAKEVAAFSKKLAGRGNIVGGLLEGRYLSQAEAVALSKIPGREVLVAKLLNVISSPLQQMVGTLSGVPRNFVGALDQISKK